MSQQRVITCRRSNEGQEQAVKAGCVERFCEKCGRGVWVSPNTFVFMAAKPEIEWEMLCNECAQPVIDAAGDDAVFLRSVPGPIAALLDLLKSFQVKP